MTNGDYDNRSDTQGNLNNKENILEKILKIGKKGKKIILGSAGVVILAGCIYLGINSVNNRGIYYASGITNEKITIKDTRNRKFGADYVDMRYDKEKGKLKVKYFKRKGILNKMKYNGERVPEDSEAFKEGEERVEKIERYIDWKKEEKLKETAEQLREPIRIRD